jgi:hypothetical protein
MSCRMHYNAQSGIFSKQLPFFFNYFIINSMAAVGLVIFVLRQSIKEAHQAAQGTTR